MFASLSRGSSKANPSYICASCLTSIFGHSELITSRQPFLHSTSQATKQPFSTTAKCTEAEDDDGSRSSAGTTAPDGATAGPAGTAELPLESSSETKSKNPTKLSTQPRTLKELRKALEDHEENGSDLMQKATKINSRTKSVKTKANKSLKLGKATKDSTDTSTKTPKSSPAKKATTTKPLLRKILTMEPAVGEATKASLKSSTPDSPEKPYVRTVKTSRTDIRYLHPASDAGIVHEIEGNPVRRITAMVPPTLKDSIDGLAKRFGPEFERKILLNALKDKDLTRTESALLKRKLRPLLISRPQAGLDNQLKAFQNINDAMQNRPLSKSQKPALLSTQRKSELAAAKESKPETNSAPKRKRDWMRSGMTAYEIETIEAEKLQFLPIEKKQPPVPGLSYGLERVLFNPGVYHLQDPRSRVFNFDPYLQKIMPASEFDFNALKEYVTSSRDNALLSAAAEEQKKYTGSTSSMTSALAHFHFLLSNWRPLEVSNLSKKFPATLDKFTAITRGPSAIFLRYRDGVYAIDADKEFDTANILMMLGKSMEKLLTLPMEEFEKYRRENSNQISEEQRNEPEAFHYSTMGDFLMRSQLDAHDERLPGTGMFDLKTRAVVSIRMDINEYKDGMGYEIRSRHGEFESFEREYYDMIRAAFLKYSLQVRMGRMDGIFVAFHNAQRIFGFQYISISEMDYALHGTEDTTIGDSEFKLSLELLNRALDRATAAFPGKSLRMHFETRDAEIPFTYIFAEPVEEEEITRIQETNKAKVEAFEREVLGLDVPEKSEAELKEEARKAEWEEMQAKVEESVENDELGISEALEAEQEEMSLAAGLNGNTPDDGDCEEDDDEDEDDQIAEGDEEDEDSENIDGLAVDSEDQLGENDAEEGEQERSEDDNEDEDQEDQEDADIEENGVEKAKNEETREDGESNIETSLSESGTQASNNTLLLDGGDISEEEVADEDKYKEESKEETSLAGPEEQAGGYTILLDEGEIPGEEVVDEDKFQEKGNEEAKLADTENQVGEKTDLLEKGAISSEDNGEQEEAAGSPENTDNTITNDNTEDQVLGLVPNGENQAQTSEKNAAEKEPKKERPLIGMILSVRNKVNDSYVKRPVDLTSDDKWTVEYALAEIPQRERAWKLYKSLKDRRQKTLDKEKKNSKKANGKLDFNQKFIDELREFNRKGREWRQKQDELEKENPPKVLFVKEFAKANGVNGEGEKND